MPRKGHWNVGAALAVALALSSAQARAEEAAAAPDIRIELPEPPEAVVIAPELDQVETGAVAEATPPQEAEPRIDLPLPEPPEAVVIAPADLPEVTVAVPLPPPAPEMVVIAVPPPAPPQAPAAQAEAEVGAIPAETLKAALLKLRAAHRLTEAEAAGALAFYEARGFAPLWIDNGRWNGRGRALRARLAQAGDDGLDPIRYRSVAAFHAAGEPHFPALAAAEAQLTEALVLYGREAAVGRVRPDHVHELMTPKLVPPTAAATLAAVSTGADPAGVLDGFNPPHPEYAALRKALAEARANRPVAQPGDPIPDGPPIRLGMRDPRVPLIRARLGLGPDGAPIYDREVSVKVAGLQRDNRLPVTGLFTPATRRAMLGEGPSADEAEIIANMEFWRWMPRELGPEHVFVNAPGLEMLVRRDGAVAHRARIIIGKTQTQTPFFSAEMDHLVVNPSWYIPPGILKREPKYLDPAYAAARGYEIRTRGNYTSVRVPPSSSNALGNVKFMFPNGHSVYMHDTPSRRLFDAANRALSNGCVRVENPFQLAALLFEDEGWTEAKFKRLIGGGERRMNLPRKMPVHLGYFTLSVDADGRLVRHQDIYGHAFRLRQLLGVS